MDTNMEIQKIRSLKHSLGCALGAFVIAVMGMVLALQIPGSFSSALAVILPYVLGTLLAPYVLMIAAVSLKEKLRHAVFLGVSLFFITMCLVLLALSFMKGGALLLEHKVLSCLVLCALFFSSLLYGGWEKLREESLKQLEAEGWATIDRYRYGQARQKLGVAALCTLAVAPFSCLVVSFNGGQPGERLFGVIFLLFAFGCGLVAVLCSSQAWNVLAKKTP